MDFDSMISQVNENDKRIMEKEEGAFVIYNILYICVIIIYLIVACAIIALVVKKRFGSVLLFHSFTFRQRRHTLLKLTEVNEHNKEEEIETVSEVCQETRQTIFKNPSSDDIKQLCAKPKQSNLKKSE